GAMVASGYSREFEKDADFWGRVYLAQAGFDISGAKTALEKIDIMKRQRPDLFSSLLMTHPYILDRLYEAEESPITFSKDPLIKQKTEKAGDFIQDYLIKEAGTYTSKDKKYISLLLYRNTYYLYPEGARADKALYELTKNREELERKKNKYLTNWNFLIGNYEKILKDYPNSSLKEDVTKRLKKLKQERDEIYKWYEENILPENGGQAVKDMSLDYYSNFIAFFPESPLVPKARYFIGQKYISANKYDKGLNEFVTLMRDLNSDEWGRNAKEEIIPIIDKSTDIVLLGELLNLNFPSEVKAKINARLKETIPQVKDLEPLNKFSKEFPESEHKEIIAQRKEKLAEELYIEARAQSLSGNWYKTVTIYRQILKYAPDSPSAEQIRQEFQRLEQIRRTEAT
ncbi:MAG: M48 family metalloprotease, partial [Candidatus Ratteibacteria bacterium]|nr:M48 family metalloprotease [Candidatus Ratteibacteria bacterium]